MIVTILLFLIAFGVLGGAAKVARYRALGPDGRRTKKLAKLTSLEKRATARSQEPARHPMDRSLWAIRSQVIANQIANIHAEGRVKQLAASVEELQAKVVEINPEATPLELELGIGPSAGSKLAQGTIDRIDAELSKIDAEQERLRLSIAAAARKRRADEGLCCKFCYGEDHKADDCIQNPATLNESLARQEPLWSDRDHQARLAREAERDATQVYTWGQSQPVAEFSNGDEVMYRARPMDLGRTPRHISRGRVMWRPQADKAARQRGLWDLYNNGVIEAEFFERELRKVIDTDATDVLDDLLKHLKGLSDE
jgi:hypothetical protein